MVSESIMGPYVSTIGELPPAEMPQFYFFENEAGSINVILGWLTFLETDL